MLHSWPKVQVALTCSQRNEAAPSTTPRPAATADQEVPPRTGSQLRKPTDVTVGIIQVQAQRRQSALEFARKLGPLLSDTANLGACRPHTRRQGDSEGVANVLLCSLALRELHHGHHRRQRLSVCFAKADWRVFDVVVGESGGEARRVIDAELAGQA